MNATAVILTCLRDEVMANMLADAIVRVWPGVAPLILWDTDKSTETDIPGDVRDVVRRVPYLRRVFDAWKLADAEDVYILDSDCLLYSEPTDFTVPAYQGVFGYSDNADGIALWGDMGVTFAKVRPCFVGGVFSARKSMWAGKEELAYEYVRECARRGWDRRHDAGVVCEQSFQAGLWRQTYPDNPLPFMRYPIHWMTPNPALWHISATKNTSYALLLIDAYRRRFCDR